MAADKKSQGQGERLSTLEERSRFHWLAFAGLAAAGCWIFFSYLPTALDHQRTAMIADTRAELLPIYKELAELSAKVTLQSPKQAANELPRILENKVKEGVLGLHTVAALAREAEKSDVKIGIPAVSQIAQEALRISDRNSQVVSAAWDAALSLTNYKSYLLSFIVPIPSNIVPVDDPNARIHWKFEARVVGDPRQARAIARMVVLPVTIDTAARAEPIGSTYNARQKAGPAQVIIDGVNTAIELDGMWYKHAVIQNAIIYYGGGPTVLEDVYFLNCRFVFQRSKSAETVLTEIAGAKTSVSVTTG